MNMLGKQCLIKPVQSRLNRLYLNKDIDTVAILLHHLLHTANLTFDAAQPINQIPVFLTFPVLCLFFLHPLSLAFYSSSSRYCRS